MSERVENIKANGQFSLKYLREAEEKNRIKREATEEGLKEGRKESLIRVNKLTSLLLEDNRLEELKLASKDRDLQEKLFKEYGI